MRNGCLKPPEIRFQNLASYVQFKVLQKPFTILCIHIYMYLFHLLHFNCSSLTTTLTEYHLKIITLSTVKADFVNIWTKRLPLFTLYCHLLVLCRKHKAAFDFDATGRFWQCWVIEGQLKGFDCIVDTKKF